VTYVNTPVGGCTLGGVLVAVRDTVSRGFSEALNAVLAGLVRDEVLLRHPHRQLRVGVGGCPRSYSD